MSAPDPNSKAEAAARAKARAAAKAKARAAARGEAAARKKPGRAAAPDPELFARAGGRWLVRLAAFAPAPADPAHLRALIVSNAAELKTFGAETEAAAVPDDLLAAAASSGALTCMPFLDILDGGCFARAPCLCCYEALSAQRAREAGAALRIFRRYYDPASYLESRAYARVVAALSRDLRADEVAEVAQHLAVLDSTPDAVREINGRWAGRLCVAAPPCQPGVLWVYSTVDGRRLLRHLARGLRKGGAPVKVTVASSDPAVAPRFRYRMYAAAPVRGEGPALLEAALAWARARAGPGTK